MPNTEDANIWQKISTIIGVLLLGITSWLAVEFVTVKTDIAALQERIKTDEQLKNNIQDLKLSVMELRTQMTEMQIEIERIKK